MNININIELKKGKKIIIINNKPFENHRHNGITADAGDISKYNPIDLGYLRPILVNFGCDYCSKNNLTSLTENISAEFFLDKKANVIPLITITDPIDMDSEESHKKYQMALYSVIKSKDFTWFPEGFSIIGTIRTCSKELSSENKITLWERKCVLDVQFSFVIQAGTYKEVFIVLNKIIEQLDREARAKMK